MANLQNALINFPIASAQFRDVNLAYIILGFVVLVGLSMVGYATAILYLIFAFVRRLLSPVVRDVEERKADRPSRRGFDGYDEGEVDARRQR